MKSKKSEISMGFVVSMIVLVLGFIVLMIFFYNIGGTGTLSKDVCHTSVVFRATLPTMTQDYIPLKCQTEKICIVGSNSLIDFSKKSCSDFQGEQGINTVKVKNVQQIEKLYAQKIVECWEMMGEGKVSLFTQYGAKTFGIGSVYPTCVICSRIAFDKTSLDSAGIDWSSMDVARYMMEHKVPGKNYTYFEYVASQDGKVAIKDNLNSNLPDVNAKTDANGVNTLTTTDAQNKPSTLSTTSTDLQQLKADEAKNPDIKTKQNAILFMQISSPKQGESLANIGTAIAGGAAGSFALAPTLTGRAFSVTLGACTKGGQAALICGAIAAIATIGQQINVALDRSVAAGKCGDISVGTDARNGCSVVRTVNYDPADISQYCSAIESIP
jgi:hypothetical protein